MLPIHNILHPTDFSEHSLAAFQLAGALARDYNANLTIVHVMPEPVLTYNDGLLIAPSPEDRWEVHARLLRLRAPAGVRLFRRLEEGDPATEILRVADLIPADLIVMGARGCRGPSSLLTGTVAEYVLERSACPVLTARMPITQSATPDWMRARNPETLPV